MSFFVAKLNDLSLFVNPTHTHPHILCSTFSFHQKNFCFIFKSRFKARWSSIGWPINSLYAKLPSIIWNQTLNTKMLLSFNAFGIAFQSIFVPLIYANIVSSCVVTTPVRPLSFLVCLPTDHDPFFFFSIQTKWHLCNGPNCLLITWANLPELHTHTHTHGQRTPLTN